MAILVSNAGGDDFETFLNAYQATFETPLDELELFMRIRNALAEKASDENEDRSNKANKPPPIRR